jgi:N-acetylglucosamine-binding protein A
MKKLLFSASTLCFLTNKHVEAHGYISFSRNKKCADGINVGCGNIIYEPQSLEGPDGFPQGGPPDGRIASADGERPSQTSGLFLQLDQPGASRWQKTNVQPGSISFPWTFTANHVTRDWRYYLTRDGWNPEAPLARASFDLNPFCVVSGNMAQPPFSLTHTCNLPARSGYHVVLAVWDVGDTVNAFYNCLDVQFGGVAAPAPAPAPAPVVPATIPVAPAPASAPAPAPAPAPVAAPRPRNHDRGHGSHLRKLR